MQWGERHHSPTGPRRVFSHTRLRDRPHAGRALPGLRRSSRRPRELEMRPGPGMTAPLRDDPVTLALREPHRLLQPL